MASLVLQNGSYTKTLSFSGSANETVDLTGWGVNSKSTNGYLKLANGLIIQWGYGNGTVTLPIVFPNAAVTVVASKDINADNYSTVYSLTTTSFGIRNGSAWWIAIGY